MIYLRLCFDRSDADDLRNEVRPAHRLYLKPFLLENAPVRLIQAGPVCASETDSTNIGSFMMIEAQSIIEAQAFHDGDPFTRAGLFERVLIHRWERHFGFGS